MSEAAAQAKRLFDRESWADAVNALEAVLSGKTGDDAGNRQIAEYLRAIALFRLDRVEESYGAFRSVASVRNHLKRRETLLWISKIARQHPELVSPGDLASYDVSDVERFKNPEQLEVFAIAAYLVGRERVAEGEHADARKLLGQVPETHAWFDQAKKCLALAK